MSDIIQQLCMSSFCQSGGAAAVTSALGVLFAVSELLSMLPGVKSNGVLQAIFSTLTSVISSAQQTTNTGSSRLQQQQQQPSLPTSTSQLNQPLLPS